MALTEDFSAGNSTFTAGARYDTPTSPDGGTDPYDPLYPNIVASECVTVVDGKVDAGLDDGEIDYVIAAVAFGENPAAPFAFDGTRSSVQCTYVPTTESLLQAYYHVPIAVMYPSGVSIGVFAEDAEPPSGLVADAAPFYLEIRSGNWGLPVYSEEFTYPFVVGTPYTFDLEWQAGTLVLDGTGDVINVLSDGWVRLLINGVQVLELTDQDVYFGFTGAGSAGPHHDNTVDQVWFGYYGLMGQLDDVSIAPALSPLKDYTWQIKDLTDATRWMTGLLVFPVGETPSPGVVTPRRVIIPMHVVTRVVFPSRANGVPDDCCCH